MTVEAQKLVDYIAKRHKQVNLKWTTIEAVAKHLYLPAADVVDFYRDMIAEEASYVK